MNYVGVDSRKNGFRYLYLRFATQIFSLQMFFNPIVAHIFNFNFPIDE